MPTTEEHREEKLSRFKSLSRFLRPTAPLWLLVLGGFAWLYYLLFADYHLKTIFELYGSQFHNTFVSVGSAHLSLGKGKIELKDIQIAHPSLPTRNLYEIHSLEGKFQLAPLFRRQLVFERVLLNGIRYLTPRQVHERPLELNPFQSSLPVFEKFSSNLFSSLNSNLAKNPLKHLAQLSTGLHTRELIDERLARLTSTLTLDTIQRELAKIEHSVEEVSGRTNEEDLTKLNDTKKLIEEALVSIREKLTSLEQDVQTDTAEIRKSLGLPETNTDSLAPIIFGPKALYFLETIGQWVEFTRRKMPIKSGPVGKSYVLQERERGTSVHFPYLAGNPTLVVLDLTIKSEEDKEKGTGFVEGHMTGLTTDPYIYGKATTGELNMSFPSQGLNGIKIAFSVDHVEDEPKEHLEISIDSLALLNSEICKTTDLSLLISKGEGALKVSADFSPHSLKTHGWFKSNRTEFKVSSRYKKIEEYVQTLLLPFYQFELTAKAEGPMDELKLELNSSLDTKLTAGLNDEIQRQLSAVDTAIKNDLLDHIMPKKHEYLDRLDKMRRVDLSNILDQIQRVKSINQSRKTTRNEHLSEQSELQ